VGKWGWEGGRELCPQELCASSQSRLVTLQPCGHLFKPQHSPLQKSLGSGRSREGKGQWRKWA